MAASNLRGAAKGRNCAVPGGAIDRLNSVIELQEAGNYKCATTTQTTTTDVSTSVCPQVGDDLSGACCEIVRNPCVVCSCDTDSAVVESSCVPVESVFCDSVGLSTETPIICITPCTTTSTTTPTTTTTPTATPKVFNQFRKLLKPAAVGASTFGELGDDICPAEQVLDTLPSPGPNGEFTQPAIQTSPDRPTDKTCFEEYCTVGIPQENGDTFASVQRNIDDIPPVEIRRMVPWNLGVEGDDYVISVTNEWYLNGPREGEKAKNKMILFSQSDSVMQALDGDTGNGNPNLEVALFKNRPDFSTPVIRVDLTMDPPADTDLIDPPSITRSFEFGFPELREFQSTYFNPSGRTYLAVRVDIKMPERHISVSVETCTHLFLNGLCTFGFQLDPSPQSPAVFAVDGLDLSGYSPRSCIATATTLAGERVFSNEAGGFNAETCTTFVGSGSRLANGRVTSTRENNHVDGCPISFDVRTTNQERVRLDNQGSSLLGSLEQIEDNDDE